MHCISIFQNHPSRGKNILLLGKVQKKKFILQSTIVLDLEKPG
jgi:hypothetical protein